MLPPVVLLVIGGLVASGLKAQERVEGSGAVAGSAPPLPVPTVAPPPLARSVVGTASTNTAGPRIQFASPVHDFGRIKGGAVVEHTYTFTNIGNGLLEVTNVRASCGCTTAGAWSRQVQPGETGTIPIEFNSGNFSGQVAKSISVNCNDTSQPTVVLQLKANIWKPIDVTPQYAALNVTSEAPAKETTVRIVNNEEVPLTLSAPEGTNRALATELRTIQPGKEFALIVRTVPPLPAGSVQDQITLKTSSTNMPAINVRAWASVQPAVLVMPALITLPVAPLPKPMPSTISIRNNGTNALALTEPVVNAQGVEVQLKELQPGRYFTLTVNFPAGFEIPQGEQVEVRVKSNHPQFPILKVPVRQAPRPAPVTAPTPGQLSQPARPPVTSDR